jgi:cell division protein FtsA
MMKDIHSSVLVAIDMGSQTFRAMAAEKTERGLLRVLGVEESSQKSCVKYGLVDNTGDAGFMVGNIMKLLGNRIRVENLHSVYVCGGGQSMKIVSVSSSRDLVHKREITSQLLDKMELECKEKIETKHPDISVLDLIPSYYVLDGKEQDYKPTSDQRAIFVEAHFVAFVGKKELETRVKKTFQQTAISLEHMFVRPEAHMNVLTSDVDMEQGCAILDFGAQTTTLSLYKGGECLSTFVQPKGGLDITEKIETLGISLPYAEHMKCVYGIALPELITKNRQYVLKGNDGQKVTISTKQLSETIADSLDEILQPIIDVLNREAGRYKVLYITGAGAMLQGLQEYLQKKTTLKVMYGSHATWLTPDTPDEFCMPQYSSLVGTLLLAADYRELHPQVKPFSKNKPIIERIMDKTLEIFSQSDY